MKYDFAGKVILASGAASGMGLLACKNVVEYGGSAVMCDINKDALDAARDAIKASTDADAAESAAKGLEAANAELFSAIAGYLKDAAAALRSYK